MRRGILVLVVFVMSISFNPVGLFAQGNSAAKKMIVGTWEITDLNDIYKAMNAHCYFKFMENGKVEFKTEMSGMATKEHDTWVVDDSGKVITISGGGWTSQGPGQEFRLIPEGTSKEFKLVELTSEKMVLKIDDSETILTSKKMTLKSDNDGTILGILGKGDSDAKKMIVGTWKLSEFKPSEALMNSIPKEEKEKMEVRIMEMKETSIFKFMEDGKYEFKSKFEGQEQKEEATWTVDDTWPIITTNADGKITEMELSELTSERMVLKVEGGSEMILVKSEK